MGELIGMGLNYERKCKACDCRYSEDHVGGCPRCDYHSYKKVVAVPNISSSALFTRNIEKRRVPR